MFSCRRLAFPSVFQDVHYPAPVPATVPRAMSLSAVVSVSGSRQSRPSLPPLFVAGFLRTLARSLGRSLARPSGTHDDEGREAPRRRATAPKLMLVLFIAMRACALSAPPPLPPCACDLRRFHDFSASLSLLTIQKMQRSSHCRWGSLSEVENCSNCVFTCGKASRSTCDILRVGGGGLWFSLFSLENLATKC